jgi:hypothetical protein
VPFPFLLQHGSVMILDGAEPRHHPNQSFYAACEAVPFQSKFKLTNYLGLNARAA